MDLSVDSNATTSFCFWLCLLHFLLLEPFVQFTLHWLHTPNKNAKHLLFVFAHFAKKIKCKQRLRTHKHSIYSDEARRTTEDPKACPLTKPQARERKGTLARRGFKCRTRRRGLVLIALLVIRQHGLSVQIMLRTQKQALEPMHYKCSHHECAAPPLYINIIKQKRQRLKNGQLDMCGDITRTLYILFVHSIQDGSGDLCLSLENVASWSNSVIASAKILSSFFFPQPMLICMALNLSFIVILPPVPSLLEC